MLELLGKEAERLEAVRRGKRRVPVLTERAAAELTGLEEGHPFHAALLASLKGPAFELGFGKRPSIWEARQIAHTALQAA